MTNALKDGKNDSAIIKLNPNFSVSNVPHDSEVPSRESPAIGMYSAKSTTGTLYFLLMRKALNDCSAQMDHVALMVPDDRGKRIEARRRT